MLVLTRKIGQEFIIAGVIRVTVLEIRKDVVRLGFQAPGEVIIHRREVHDRIAGEMRCRPAHLFSDATP